MESKRVITDANKIPLGRPPVNSGIQKSSGPSLLKPSYLTGGDSNSGNSVSVSTTSSQPSQQLQYSNHSIHQPQPQPLMSIPIQPPPGQTSAAPTSTASISFDLKKHHYEYEQYFNIINSTPSTTTFNTYPNMPNSNANPTNSNYANFQIQQIQQPGGPKMSTDYSSWSEPSINSGSSSALVKVSNDYSSLNNLKRGGEDGNGSADDEARKDRKRKRRSRWMGSENEKAVIPGMPTILPSDLPPGQVEAYVAQLQIEELSRKLRTGDLGIPPNAEDRSPSPEPIYGTDGKRLNTREYRTRKKLEEERHKLIQQLSKLNPEYKPPADYRAPVIKIVDRVPIPQEENPEINFVGLLIGPRGNTLKGLEKDTGAKIIIRGKGSVKEGKVGGKAGHPLPGEDEPLHAYVTSNNPDSVKKACDKIKEIIRQGIEMPESQNDLRKNQLRELALLNGTLREGEGPKCTNCGATSHRTWNCPDKPNITSSVVCTVCGGAGHIGKDCRMKRPGAGGPPIVNENEKAKIDQEYLSLMAELGEGPPPTSTKSGDRPSQATSTGNLFGKPAPLKQLMSIQVQPPPHLVQNRKEWSSSSQPEPPGEKPPSLMSQQNWSYPSQASSYQQQPQKQQWGAQQWSAPAPPPPVPPPPSQPPPPGMYWQGGSYNMAPVNPPPPPPPDYKPPPPPPN